MNELRIRSGRARRAFDVAKFDEAVYVLHAFEKKSQRTSRADIEIGVRRYGVVLERHRQHQRRRQQEES